MNKIDKHNQTEMTPLAQRGSCELESARLELAELGTQFAHLDELGWSKTSSLLGRLSKDYPQQCAVLKLRAQEELLERISRCSARELPEYLVDQLANHDGPSSVLELCVPPTRMSRALGFLRSFSSHEARRTQAARAALDTLRLNLRQRGECTPFPGLPSESAPLHLASGLLEQTLPDVPTYTGSANIMDLHSWLLEADKLGLVPDEFRESVSNQRTVTHKKYTHLQHIKVLLEKYRAVDQKDSRLGRIKCRLQHYSAAMSQRFAAAKSEDERRTLYLELVEWIGYAVGFAGYHCEDGQFRAADALWKECCTGQELQHGSTAEQLKLWAAGKRDSLFNAIIYDMIMQRSRELKRPLDVSSAISTWRCVFREECGLSRVTGPQWWVEAELSVTAISKRFKERYTARWLIEAAWDEFRQPGGHAQLNYVAMDEYLCSRFTQADREAMRYACVDEDGSPRREALLLYLIEAGLVTRDA